MRFLVSNDEFQAAIGCVDEVVAADGEFSWDSLGEVFSSFRFMSFSSIFRRELFRAVSALSNSDGTGSVLLLVLEPDPVRYRTEFGRYNAVVFDKEDEAEDYIGAINDGPNGSSADSIIDGADRLFISPVNGRWLLAGDRRTNLAYCCFEDDDAMTRFERLYSGEFFPDIASAEDFSAETTGQKISLSSFGRGY